MKTVPDSNPHPGSDPADGALETRLRELTWKPVTVAALRGSLEAALAALPAQSGGEQPGPSERISTAEITEGDPVYTPGLSKVRRFFPSMPGFVRWGLAACWVLSAGFRLATPASPRAENPAGNPSPVFAGNPSQDTSDFPNGTGRDALPSGAEQPDALSRAVYALNSGGIFQSMQQSRRQLHALQLELDLQPEPASSHGRR